jgi:hypothetical protein
LRAGARLDHQGFRAERPRRAAELGRAAVQRERNAAPHVVVIALPRLEQMPGEGEVSQISSFRSSSRSRPMKLSTEVFCWGLPDTMCSRGRRDWSTTG